MASVIDKTALLSMRKSTFIEPPIFCEFKSIAEIVTLEITSELFAFGSFEGMEYRSTRSPTFEPLGKSLFAIPTGTSLEKVPGASFVIALTGMSSP